MSHSASYEVRSAAYRRSCHTTAGSSGRPVTRSHSIAVARWVDSATAVIPMPSSRARPTARRATSTVAVQISIGSCSTERSSGWLTLIDR